MSYAVFGAHLLWKHNRSSEARVLLDALYFIWQPWSQDTGLNHEAAAFVLGTGHFRAL